jgi:hypothetical protein
VGAPGTVVVPDVVVPDEIPDDVAGPVPSDAVPLDGNEPIDDDEPELPCDPTPEPTPKSSPTEGENDGLSASHVDTSDAVTGLVDGYGNPA